MPSVVFYLTTRLSPQTVDPKAKILPSGGKPQVTLEDVQRAIGVVRDAVAWQCVAAKWLRDEKALDGLVKMAELHSWREWRNRKRRAKIDVFTHQKISELAVLEWFNPNSLRTDSGRSKYLGCSRPTYVNNYRPHVVLIQNWLESKEWEGIGDIDNFINGDKRAASA